MSLAHTACVPSLCQSPCPQVVPSRGERQPCKQIQPTQSDKGHQDRRECRAREGSEQRDWLCPGEGWLCWGDRGVEVLSIAGKVGFHQLDKRGRGWWQISSSRGKTCSKAQSPEPAWKSHDTHESSLPGAGPQEGGRALGDEQGRLEAGEEGWSLCLNTFK